MSENKKNLKNRMQSFDIFSKLPDEMVEGTTYGTIISILVLIVIGYLSMSEYRLFYRTNVMVNTEMILDDSSYLNQKIQLNFDFTLHRMPCEVISLDSQDEMGSHHINNGDIQKQPLDKNGGKIRTLIHTNKQNMEAHDDSYSGQLDIGQLRESMKDDEGCRIYGKLLLNRVPGNFHISSHAFGGFLQMILGDDFKMDLQHTINKFSFTDPGLSDYDYSDFTRAEKAKQAGYDFEHDPLQNLNSVKVKDNQMEIMHKTTYSYFLQIVPTKFVYHEHIFGNDDIVYQYVANRHSQYSHMMPAIYVKYELSSIAMKYNFTSQELSHFLIEIFAIIGGIFTIAGLLDSLISSILPGRKTYVPL